MKISTYNVNGVNARLPVLLRWLEKLKTPQEKFPLEAFTDAGYSAVWHGQKNWNGVAILARGNELQEIRRGLPGDTDDTQSRYIEAAVNGRMIVVPGAFDVRNEFFGNVKLRIQFFVDHVLYGAQTKFPQFGSCFFDAKHFVH